MDAISNPNWDPLPYPTAPSHHLEQRFISVSLFLGSGLTILCSMTHLMVNLGVTIVFTIYSPFLLRASIEGPLSFVSSNFSGELSHAFVSGQTIFVQLPFVSVLTFL